MLWEAPRLWRFVLLVCLALLGVIGYWPSPVDRPIQGEITHILLVLHAHGWPGWINYAFVEASANVALFVPMGFVASLAFPARRWWYAAMLGLLASGSMELGQQLFLHNRFASPVDLVTNTAGCTLGALIAQLMIRLRPANSPWPASAGISTNTNV